jgi:hypothetical protein
MRVNIRLGIELPSYRVAEVVGYLPSHLLAAMLISISSTVLQKDSRT